MNDPLKGNAVDKFWPIFCLSLTGMTADTMYDYLESEHVLTDEQKGYYQESWGTKDKLLIDKAVLRDCKKRNSVLAMAWNNYKKAYDLIFHRWIRECLEIFGAAENITQISH